MLAPTRELAIQTGESFATYGKRLQLRQALVYGGVSQVKQVRTLNRGAHILVATPGRLLDLMIQGHIELHQLEVLVLDEVDRMLDMGFLPDLKRIISQLPNQGIALSFCSASERRELRATEELIGEKLPLSTEQPHSEKHRPSTPAHRQRDAQVQRLALDGSGSQHCTTPNLAMEPTKEDKPIQKRRRRWRRSARRPVSQTS